MNKRYIQWRDWDADAKTQWEKSEKRIKRAEKIIEREREKYDQWFYYIHQERKPIISRTEEREIFNEG